MASYCQCASRRNAFSTGRMTPTISAWKKLAALRLRTLRTGSLAGRSTAAAFIAQRLDALPIETALAIQQCHEGLDDEGSEIELAAFEVMPGAFNEHDLRRRRNQFRRCGDLFGRAEGIPCSLNEKRGHLQRREVSGAGLFRLFWRMQGVRKQEQSIASLRIFGREERRLPSAIRLAARENAIGGDGAHCIDGSANSGTILSRSAWIRRPIRA